MGLTSNGGKYCFLLLPFLLTMNAVHCAEQSSERNDNVASEAVTTPAAADAVTGSADTKPDSRSNASPQPQSLQPQLLPESASDKPERSGSGNKPVASVSSGKMTPGNINKIIENTDIYGEQFRINSIVENDLVTIQTWFNPRSRNPEHDSKIDAVLIAKKLLDAFPQQNPTVKLRYFDRQDKKKYFEITVVPGVVKAFAAGIMPEADLLKSLVMLPSSGDISPVPESVPAVATATAAIDPRGIVRPVGGYRYEDRGRLFARMKELESKGVKASFIRVMFAEMETAARDGNMAQADALYLRLNRAIKDTEDNYQKAHNSKAVPVGTKPPETRGSASSAESAILASVTDMRKLYGEFYPEYGPCYPDRVFFADKLRGMKKKNLPYAELLSKFRKIENMVALNDPSLETKVQEMYKELHIKPIVRDFEYQQNQRLADLLKSRLIKSGN